MPKRITALIIAMLMCVSLLTLTSCKKSEIPEGMYSATVDGEPFILYVPKGWIDNRDSGISSAYYSLADAATVSARSYVKGDMTLSEYINKRTEEYTRDIESFALAELSESALSGRPAMLYRYTFDRVIDANGSVANAKISARQYYAENGSEVIVLTMYCRSDAVNEDYNAAFEMIRGEFVITERTQKEENVRTDKKTPEGMKIASHKSSEYVFYVPTAWHCTNEDKLSEAYYPESGSPNVTVTSFAPDGEITAAEYFEQCERIYKSDIAGYELISVGEERVVGERKALPYTYKAVIGGEEYRIMQTVLVYNGLVYSMTYTAPADLFDSHLDDVERMLTAFRFR